MVTAVFLGAALLALVFALMGAARRGDDLMAEDAAVLTTPEPEPEEMHPQETPEHGGHAWADVRLLAKILQMETREGWPDWAVMCVGEVVLNRVASPLFPDTIRGVLYQDGPIQYAPVWEPGWEDREPGPEYVDLAVRLLDGERPLGDPEVVWQALFPQGQETIATYHDRVLDNTTYFCR